VTVRLPLGPEERDVLRRLPQELLELLKGGPDEPALRRLFPPAYASEETNEYEDEYRQLMGSDLVERHRVALQTVLDTVDARELTEEQAHLWMIALNELRLVLGTTLDVQEDDEELEDPNDPRAPAYGLYQYLTYLQGWLIDQLEP